MSRFVPGNWRSSSAVIDAISRRADSSAMPGFRRAKMRRLEPLRLDARGARSSGAQSWAFVAQNGANWKDGGMTPTTE